MMAITFFHQLAFFDKTFLIYNGAKAGIDTLQLSHPKLFERAYKINVLVFALDIGFVLYMGVDLFTHFANRRAFELLPASVILVVCSGTCLLIFAVGCVGKINDYFKALHEHEKNDDLKNSKIESHWYRPTDQKIYQGIVTSQVVLSVILIFFSTQPFFYAASAATQGFRLLKVSELKWLRVKDAYFLVQKAPAKPEENCVICSKEQPNIYFCSQHLCHLRCALERIDKKSEEFRRCPSPACQQEFVALDVKQLD